MRWRRRARRRALSLAAVAVAIALGAFIYAEAGPADRPEGSTADATVVRVVDGDTIVVTTAGGTEHTIRLIGVDTPETVRPNSPVECFGPEASAYLTDLLTGQAVTLTSDPSQDDQDRYGRLLRYVSLEDGTAVNAALIEHGYGREYTYRTAYAEQLHHRELEAAARAAGAGLWAAC